MATEALILRGQEGSSSWLYITSGATGRIYALISMVLNSIVLMLFFPFRGSRRVLSSSHVDKQGKKEDNIINNNKQVNDSHRKAVVVRVPAAFKPWRSYFAAAAKAVDEAVEARRSLAIRRVVEDGDENTVREYCLIGSKRGDTIFTQSWTPVNGKIR